MKDDFVTQAGILALAGILVRIIGLLYRSPLTSIIGDEGNGYYGFAYNIYTIILLISSYSIPSAIAKVMAQKIAVGEYKDAHRVFQCALIYVTVVGGIAALFAYFAAPILVVEHATSVLRIFAPTIFLSGFLGVLRGYYQAHRTMVPTSMSQILEQILNAGVSIGAAWLFILLYNGNSETEKAIKGASGSALGTGMGVFIALLFLILIFISNRKKMRREIRKDRTGVETPYSTLFKELLLIVTPFILSTFVYNLSTSLNQTIYSKIMMGQKGFEQEKAALMYGIFSGKPVVITNIPIAFSSAMAAALIPGIAASYIRREKKQTLKKVRIAMKITMLISIPCAAGLCFLSKPIMQLLFPQKSSLDMASDLLRVLSVTVIFYSVSTLTNAVLQGIGKVNLPVIHALIALAIQTPVLVLLLMADANLYALVLATIIYSLVMCILNGRVVRKKLGFRMHPMNMVIKPVLAALGMGILAFGVYHLIYLIVPINALALVFAILVAIPVYFILVLLMRAVKEEEIKAFPNGRRLCAIAKKMKLL